MTTIRRYSLLAVLVSAAAVHAGARPAAAVGAAPAPPQAPAAVRVWQDTVVFPSYPDGPPDPNPPFDLFETGRYNYPYTLRANLTDTRVDKAWRALWVENEYLKCLVLPDLAGAVTRTFAGSSPAGSADVRPGEAGSDRGREGLAARAAVGCCAAPDFSVIAADLPPSSRTSVDCCSVERRRSGPRSRRGGNRAHRRTCHRLRRPSVGPLVRSSPVWASASARRSARMGTPGLLAIVPGLAHPRRYAA